MSGGVSSAAVPIRARDAKPPLYAYARRGFTALVAVVPGVLWSGIKGALSGFVLIGLALTAITVGFAALNVLMSTAVPKWLLVAGALVVPLSFSVAGAYVGGVRGILSALARELVERNIIDYLYAFVRPVLLRTASDLAKRTTPVTRSELAGRLRQVAKERVRKALDEEGASRSLIERLERHAAMRLQLLLVAAALTPTAGVQDRDAAIAELENTGIQKIEETIAEGLEGLFVVQQLLAFGIALGVSAVPYLFYVAIR
jgi:hypothetical protein